MNKCFIEVKLSCLKTTNFIPKNTLILTIYYIFSTQSVQDMQKVNPSLALFIVILLLNACSGSSSETTEENPDTDSMSNQILDSNNYMDTVSDYRDDQGYVNEEVELSNEIEKKYGVQWDFCTCVVTNDSLEKALEKSETDEETDAIIARWDQVDSHCKEILTTPNNSPEDRAAHDAKVKKCLRNK